MFKVGLFDDVNDNDLQNNVLSEDHDQFTRTVSEASQVLLKNAGNLLPLKKSEKLKIAVVGLLLLQLLLLLLLQLLLLLLLQLLLLLLLQLLLQERQLFHQS
jgi:hypothetical protein